MKQSRRPMGEDFIDRLMGLVAQNPQWAAGWFVLHPSYRSLSEDEAADWVRAALGRVAVQEEIPQAHGSAFGAALRYAVGPRIAELAGLKRVSVPGSPGLTPRPARSRAWRVR